MNQKNRLCIENRWTALLVLVSLLLAACQAAPARPEVVVYTSVDQVYAEPILKAFEAQSGVRVLAVYDVEAAKTTGLVNRLIAEKDRPQADVFWNGEFAQTLRLKQQGVLAPYTSSVARDIPKQYVDPEGYWHGFGGRARILLINTDRVKPEDYPSSLQDLLSDRWPGEQIGIANPLFGTTATQAAALYAAWGQATAQDFFTRLKARRVQVVDGNSVVRDMVAGGQLALGLTDTDDACGAVQKGAPVKIVFLDQESGGLGTLIVPNTTALIANGPHPEQGRALIDYLLSPAVEKQLIENGWFNLALRPSNAISPCPIATQVQGMSVALEQIYQQMDASQKDLSELFLR